MIIRRDEWTRLLTLLWSSTTWKLFLAKTLSIPARQNQFLQENVFKNAAVCQVSISMKTNSGFNWSYTENLFWYRQFHLKQIGILRGGHPIVYFDAADICLLYVTTMKAIHFQDDIPSIPIDNFKDHHVLVFDLTSMQHATEKCHYPDFVGEPLRMELNFTYPLEQVTELIVLGDRMSSAAFDKFGVVGKTSRMDNGSLQEILNRIPLLKYEYRGSFPSDYVPTLDNDTFAIINMPPSNMQAEHWVMIANSCQIL